LKILILASGHKVQLDDDSYEIALPFIWRVSFNYRDLAQKEILVVSTVKNSKGRLTNLLLPRLIMRNPPKDYAVKFKDGNRLNMQKRNLYLIRFCKLSIKKQKWLKEQAKPKKGPFNSNKIPPLDY
jgi:hypothetical protein